MESGERAFNEALRAFRHTFAAEVEPWRPALFRYCRQLTGDPFAAEDLHQETFLRAFAALSERFEPLHHPRAYLFRIATRLWLDARKRRREVLLEVEVDVADATSPVSAREVEQALAALLRHLPPRELAALLLRDVYDFTGAEAAAILGTSEAAVKMAVVRARRRVRQLPPEPTLAGDPGSAELLHRFVAAFRAHDAEALTALIAENAVARAVGCAEEHGRDEILRGTMRYAQQAPVLRCEVVRYRDRWLVAFWYRSPEGTEAVADLLAVEVEDGRIASMALYWFCPHVLEIVGEALGLPVLTHGYRPPPGASWWNHGPDAPSRE